MLSGLCVAALTKVSSTVCGFGRGVRGRKGGKGPQVRGSGDELGQTGTQAGWSLSVPWSVRASLSVCSELAPEPAHIQGGPWNPCSIITFQPHFLSPKFYLFLGTNGL